MSNTWVKFRASDGWMVQAIAAAARPRGKRPLGRRARSVQCCYDVTGPELIGALGGVRRSSGPLAVAASKVVDVDDDEFASVFADVRGLPIAVGRLMASIGRATRKGSSKS